MSMPHNLILSYSDRDKTVQVTGPTREIAEQKGEKITLQLLLATGVSYEAPKGNWRVGRLVIIH